MMDFRSNLHEQSLLKSNHALMENWKLRWFSELDDRYQIRQQSGVEQNAGQQKYVQI